MIEDNTEGPRVAVVYYSATGTVAGLARAIDEGARKGFLDTLGGPWSRGELADKVYSGFVASDTAHGGQESTLLALYQTIHHFGGVLVAPGYTDPAKFADGNPYGTGHVTGAGPLGEVSLESARVQGRRVARIARAVRVVTPARSAA